MPGNSRLRQELRKSVNEARFSNNTGNFKANDGSVRESKRKLMPLKSFNEAHFAQVIQRIGTTATHVAQESALQSPVTAYQSPSTDVLVNGRKRAIVDVSVSSANSKASVKGKKALA